MGWSLVFPPREMTRRYCCSRSLNWRGLLGSRPNACFFFFLLVKEKQERVCQVWQSFDYSLWSLHVFFTPSWRWEDWGQVEEQGWNQDDSLTLSCTFNILVNEPCPSSQRFDGPGHALFIDNNCYRTSKGAHSQGMDVEGTLWSAKFSNSEWKGQYTTALGT